MNVIAILCLTLVSALVTMRRGPGAAFAFVLVPVLLLLSVIPPIPLPTLPDIGSVAGVALGAFVGAIIAGKLPAYRFHWIDLIVLALSASMLMTAAATGSTWTIVNASATELLKWLLPYLMARAVFREPNLRRDLALSLSYCAMFMGFVALIEWRLRPLFFSRILAQFNLAAVYNTMVLGRFHLFRAMVTTEHPIDLGNTGFMMAALIFAMATAGGMSMRDKRIQGGIIGAMLCCITSMSFSSYLGCFVMITVYLGLRYVRGSEWLLVPGVIACIIGGVLFTRHLISIDLTVNQRATRDEREALNDSFYIRTLIAQRGWAVGSEAGWLGFGDKMIGRKELGLDSVDNSYMLFLMRRGWLHLGLRFVLAIAIAALGTAMLRDARGHAMRAPPAIMVAALLGTNAAMYTVWFGFVFATLWTCALAITVTMRQVMAERRMAAFALPPGPGFPVVGHPAPHMVGVPFGRPAH